MDQLGDAATGQIGSTRNARIKDCSRAWKACRIGKANGTLDGAVAEEVGGAGPQLAASFIRALHIQTPRPEPDYSSQLNRSTTRSACHSSTAWQSSTSWRAFARASLSSPQGAARLCVSMPRAGRNPSLPWDLRTQTSIAFYFLGLCREFPNWRKNS
jgi:hypothetical protein